MFDDGGGLLVLMMVVIGSRARVICLDLFKPSSKPKNITFQFYEDKTYTKKFAGIDSVLFYIYKDEKHILAFLK